MPAKPLCKVRHPFSPLVLINLVTTNMCCDEIYLQYVYSKLLLVALWDGLVDREYYNSVPPLLIRQGATSFQSTCTYQSRDYKYVLRWNISSICLLQIILSSGVGRCRRQRILRLGSTSANTTRCDILTTWAQLSEKKYLLVQNHDLRFRHFHETPLKKCQKTFGSNAFITCVPTI